MELFSHEKHQPFVLGNGRVGVLLIHGFLGTPWEVRYLGEQLAQANCTAHGILLPGFGRDLMNLNQCSRQEWLQSARLAWEALTTQYEETILVGYSMGGAIAMQLAQELPPQKLVLLSPFWRLSSHLVHYLLPLAARFVPTFRPFERADFSHPKIRASLEELDDSLNIDDPAVQRTLRNDIKLSLSILVELRRLGLAGLDSASSSSVPTLVLQADHDAVVLPKFTEVLVNKLRENSTVSHQFIQGGHEFPKQTTAYAEPILSFVSDIVSQKEQTYEYNDLVASSRSSFA